MASHERLRRVSDAVHHVVAEVLQREINNFDLSRVTVLRCEVTGDLKEATVHYSVLGDAEDRRLAAINLGKVSGFLQHRLSKEIPTYRVPHLCFQYDSAIEDGIRLQEIFQKIEEERIPPDSQKSDD